MRSPALTRKFCLGTLVILLACMNAACGTSYKVVKVKQYRLAITQGDTSFNAAFQTLVNDYNTAAGSQVLTWESDPSAANSAVVVTKGLVNENADGLGTGKVGLGQWLSQTSTQDPLSVLPGDKATETITYSMRVEFDWDYLSTKTHYELQKLFYHEVGHGLELNHDMTNLNDVMYPDVGVGDPKDFTSYFNYVRNYVAN